MPLTDREVFKAAFLCKCAEHGLTPRETRECVRLALSRNSREKVAEGAIAKTVGLLGGAAGKLQWPVIAALVGGPPILGMIGGAALGNAVGQATDLRPEDIQEADKLEAYRRETQLARLRNAMADRRRENTSSRTYRPLI